MEMKDTRLGSTEFIRLLGSKLTFDKFGHMPTKPNPAYRWWKWWEPKVIYDWPAPTGETLTFRREVHPLPWDLATPGASRVQAPTVTVDNAFERAVAAVGGIGGHDPDKFIMRSRRKKIVQAVMLELAEPDEAMCRAGAAVELEGGSIGNHEAAMIFQAMIDAGLEAGGTHDT